MQTKEYTYVQSILNILTPKESSIFVCRTVLATEPGKLIHSHASNILLSIRETKQTHSHPQAHVFSPVEHYWEAVVIEGQSDYVAYRVKLIRQGGPWDCVGQELVSSSIAKRGDRSSWPPLAVRKGSQAPGMEPSTLWFALDGSQLWHCTQSWIKTACERCWA